jgi:hypothetical protein
MAIKMQLKKEIRFTDIWVDRQAKIAQPGYAESVKIVRLIQKPHYVTISEPVPETMIIGNDCVIFVRDEASEEASIIDEYVGEAVNTLLKEERFEVLRKNRRGIIGLSYEPTMALQVRK